MSAAHSPLAQFEIKPLVPLQAFGYDISFTNSSLWMLIAVAAATFLFWLSGRKAALVPTRSQSFSEVIIQFVSGIIKDNSGLEGMKYFPVVFSLFIFILFANMLGMVPYSFTSTSHIIVTFALAIFVFIGVTLIALIKHGPVKFLKFFVPHGTTDNLAMSLTLAPLMFVIELISYLSRPISLSLRLGANMIVGHMILKIAAGFVFMMGVFGGWLPFAFITIFTGFEIGIAVLQAYIFTVLTCVYLNDALHLHH